MAALVAKPRRGKEGSRHSSGILLREGEREIGKVVAGLAWKFR